MIKFLLIILLSVTPLVQAEPPPTTLVVFGATGDLADKKIFPAVQKLGERGELPPSFALVGVARKTEEVFRKKIRPAYPVHYSQTELDGDYQGLSALLGRIDEDFGARSRKIYYLAIQPSYFQTVVQKLSEEGLIGPEDRVVIEKPFGRDLTSALVLQKHLEQHLKERQIYRIDHYLGKEGVINLTHFRLHQVPEELWNHEHIEEVSISLSEEIGIGTRAQFWEETGLLRDVMQNHVMQLLSLVAMERGEVLAEKVKLLQAIRPLDAETIVRGQYGPGFIQGKPVVGYTEEKGVSPQSQAETFAAATFYIDNERWEGVPFHIRAGKRLAKQETEIVVRFKSGQILHLRIQPKPAIYYEGAEPIPFAAAPHSEAYEKLIADALQGDRSSFVSQEEVLSSWRLFTPVLDYWQAGGGEILIYPAGTRGP